MPCPAVTILLVILALFPRTAGAHAILMDSQPSTGATLSPGPATLTLRFNSRIDHLRSRIVLRSGQAEAVLPMSRGSGADTMVAPATLAPGPHVIRWQVLAADGHITRGDVPFTVQEQ